MSRYGDYFRAQRAGKSASSAAVKETPVPSARRLSVEEIDRQAAEQGAALLRLAGEVAARQKQEAAREAQSSPMERLASEMAADRQGRARRATAPTAALQAARPRSLGEMGQTAAAYQARQVSTQSSIPQSRAPVGGRLPGTSGGAAPLTAASFGGVTGYRNIAPVRQEQPGGLRRVAAGTDAAVSGLLGGIGSAVETGKAALGGQADFFSDVGLKGYLTTPLNQLGEARQRPEYQRQMDMDSAAARLMERAAEKTGEAVEGLGPKASWVAENLISAGQNVPAMAAALVPAVGPALSGGIMAASAGGSRAYELQQQGADAGEAFWRGAVSGGIELATEKLSIDNFLEIAKGVGAKNAVKNLLRQMGVEASEEGASYALNFIADKAASDPNAEFSLAEMANAAAGGAFSGGIFGGAGLAVNRLLYAPQTAQQAQGAARGVQAVPQAQGAAQAVQTVSQTRDAAQRVQNPVQQVQDKVQQAQNQVQQVQNQVQQVQNQVQAAPVRRAYTVQQLGGNGLKNYQFLRERDGGKTPDFDEQHAHYYNAARSGMALEQIPAYPSMTPLDGTARQAAAFAGQNDGLSEAAETVQKLMDGKAVSDTALDRALSFPETRKALAEQAGTLPGASSQARKAVRDWAAARKQETPVKQPARQRAPSGKRFRGIAEDVLSTYESTADTTEISEDLRELYEALNTPGEAALATNLRQTATGIARKILQRGVPEADELSGQYADLRKYLRTTPVTLSSADRASVPDGYETFRKRNMGRLRLVNEGGTPVDVMYQQLQADYGEGFFPANITHPADQLEQIGKVLADVRPKAGNAYASESAVHDLALDLIGRCAALPQRLQTAESNARKPTGAVGAAAGMAGEQRARTGGNRGFPEAESGRPGIPGHPLSGGRSARGDCQPDERHGECAD